jgi:hypothetical protein
VDGGRLRLKDDVTQPKQPSPRSSGQPPLNFNNPIAHMVSVASAQSPVHKQKSKVHLAFLESRGKSENSNSHRDRSQTSLTLIWQKVYKKDSLPVFLFSYFPMFFLTCFLPVSSFLSSLRAEYSYIEVKWNAAYPKPLNRQLASGSTFATGATSAALLSVPRKKICFRNTSIGTSQGDPLWA